jgi:hypothetical protein
VQKRTDASPRKRDDPLMRKQIAEQDEVNGASLRASCPMCHSIAPAPDNDTRDWRCRRCGQRWDAARLAAVAVYAAWAADHDRAAISIGGVRFRRAKDRRRSTRQP